MKKTADHWLAAGRRAGVEVALKRLRGAVDASRRKAGWIAEANSYYFTSITITFPTIDNRRQTEGLSASTRRTAMVPAKPIISRLKNDDATLYGPSTPHEKLPITQSQSRQGTAPKNPRQ
ncbi:TPA: hypothetical protein QDC27_000804 [Burkholderia cepacia ATCC 25416]|uniref:hypothetical protein n=1 Tax=Burkholderia cepacia TaxID=292 RepID=UPI001CF31E99|nr:hypothetical protein [Burkholderia cepacia]HDR9765594.1 hypothetical protein [Burkholderia cepacia ATCC 25416]MCA8077646.1 hypothetical protein [Burkholderia cepacia]HDR9773083.1 hypothetical protein [Burkholderia cepacia ATCC 25416]HDR9781823.1 hypothetical protein [Burkholderia cepacia ATCC 25416]HDR9791454.1 hypothetical protein [Burkholderia cepacia ATCC 25416]